MMHANSSLGEQMPLPELLTRDSTSPNPSIAILQYLIIGPPQTKANKLENAYPPPFLLLRN